MSLPKKSILTFFLIAIVYVWYLLSYISPHPAPIPIVGASNNIALFVQPQAGRAPILNAINSARSEVLVEVYLLSDKEIIQALKQDKARGIDVKVMLEEHPFGGGNLNNKTQKDLSSAGISVEWTNSSFALTHEKSIVIDASEAFILNQNLTGSSFTKNREYDVVDTNSEDVSQVRTIFIDDWERKSFTTTSSHLIVSPNNSRSGLTALIGSATKTLDIEIEDIDDSQVVSLLSDEAKKIQVRLIIPTFSQIGSNSNAVKELAKNGVFVKTLSSPYIHAKLILVDNAKAYIGSVNLSTQSMDRNRELGIMLSQNDSLVTLASTFNEDWNKGKVFSQK